jgi:uncharacterized delta-60 repeat protein
MINLGAGQTVGAGRYQLVRELGRGGMGIVWLAKDLRLSEEVALKFLPDAIAHDSTALEDMRRETLKSRRLSHPNIIRIYDLDETPGEAPFIAMEYIAGTTLAELKARQAQRLFSWAELKPLVRQLCDALEYAHRQKVVHRDLKPGNFMVDGQGVLKLADFGLAATAAESMTRLSRDLGSSGTPVYMSPQQMQSQAPRVADDIYSLGATFYELLTSKPPFYAGDIYRQVVEVPAVPLAERLADLELTNEIPADVAALVMACLAKDSAQRPPSALAVAQWIGLESQPEPSVIAGGSEQSASATNDDISPDDEVSPVASNLGKMIGVGAVVVIAFVLLVIGLMSRGQDGDPAAAVAKSANEALPTTAELSPATNQTPVTPKAVSNAPATQTILPFIGKASAATELDETFQCAEVEPVEGLTHRHVRKMAVQADGKILIGGLFGKVGGKPANGLARLLPDGSVDPDFKYNLSQNQVSQIGVLPDGKIMIAGNRILGIEKGQPKLENINYLVRLRPDGSHDTTFDVNLGKYNGINGLMIDAAGRTVIAGGGFSGPSGNLLPALLRLDSRGRYDTGFNPAVPSIQKNLWIGVYPPLLRRDGRIVSGISMSLEDKSIQHGLFEVNDDGRAAKVRNLRVTDDWINGLAEQPDGKLVAVGTFKTAGGQPYPGVVRFNLDGTVDRSFSPPDFLAKGAWANVVVHADGRILLAGLVTQGVNYYHLVRLLPDGRLDPSLTYSKPSDSVSYDIQLQPDGKVLLGGQFGTYNGQRTGPVVRLNYDVPTTAAAK